MTDKDAIVFSVLIISVIGLCVGAIGMDYWNEQQVRVMYQQAYAKNMECRVDISQSRGTDFVNKICGDIPKFEDYND